MQCAAPMAMIWPGSRNQVARSRRRPRRRPRGRCPSRAGRDHGTSLHSPCTGVQVQEMLAWFIRATVALSSCWHSLHCPVETPRPSTQLAQCHVGAAADRKRHRCGCCRPAAMPAPVRTAPGTSGSAPVQCRCMLALSTCWHPRCTVPKCIGAPTKERVGAGGDAAGWSGSDCVGQCI